MFLGSCEVVRHPTTIALSVIERPFQKHLRNNKTIRKSQLNVPLDVFCALRSAVETRKSLKFGMARNLGHQWEVLRLECKLTCHSQKLNSCTPLAGKNLVAGTRNKAWHLSNMVSTWAMHVYLHVRTSGKGSIGFFADLNSISDLYGIFVQSWSFVLIFALRFRAIGRRKTRSQLPHLFNFGGGIDLKTDWKLESQATQRDSTWVIEEIRKKWTALGVLDSGLPVRSMDRCLMFVFLDSFILEQKFPDSWQIRDVLIPDSFWCLHMQKTWIRSKKIPVLSWIRKVMNPECKVETLYQNTLNPKRFVRVNGLFTNPDIQRSPAIL